LICSWFRRLRFSSYSIFAILEPSGKSWTFKRNTVSPYFVNVPDTLKSVSFIEKDVKRFPNTHGWAYAQFTYDPRENGAKCRASLGKVTEPINMKDRTPPCGLSDGPAQRDLVAECRRYSHEAVPADHADLDHFAGR